MLDKEILFVIIAWLSKNDSEKDFSSAFRRWKKGQPNLDNQRSNNTQTLKILEKKFLERRTKSRNSGRENSESLGEIQDSEKPNYSKAEYFSLEKYIAYRLQRKLYFAEAKFRSCHKATRKSLRKNKLSAFWLGLNLNCQWWQILCIGPPPCFEASSEPCFAGCNFVAVGTFRTFL